MSSRRPCRRFGGSAPERVSGRPRSRPLRPVLKSAKRQGSTSLIISFVALIVIIAGGTYLYTFDQTKRALLQGAQEDLAQIIGISSTQFSAEEIDQIRNFKAGEDDTPAYLAMKTKLQEMRAVSPNVSNYSIVDIQGDQIVFLVDDAEDDAAAIGEVYDDPEARLFQANQGKQVSEALYTDKWGTFLSGYDPIQGTSGTSALIIGADILAGTILDRENFIGNTICYVMGLAILLAGVIIGLFSL